MSEQISVTLEYQHPDNDEPTRYTVQAAPEAAGTILLVMDELTGIDDPERVAAITGTIRTALSGYVDELERELSKWVNQG